MGARAAAAIAEGGNALAALDLLAALYMHVRVVPVMGADPVTVVDDDGLAEGALGAGVGDLSARRGHHVGAARAGDIDPGMELALARKR